ncbi:IS481 family transposase, partial [Vibrio anguillarum]|nr:IS481 family transposase [Vibrio anguillarum]
SSLKGLTPIEKVTELSDQIPLSEGVYQHYQVWKERFQE